MGFWQTLFGGSEGYTISNRAGATVYDAQGNVMVRSPTPSAQPVSDLNGLFDYAVKPLTFIGEQVGEFTSGISQGVKGVITRANSQANRISTAEGRDPIKQREGELCAWWNVACKVGNAASNVNSWFQGTLTKILVTVVVVAIIALFVLSFVQAKAGRLAS